MAGSAQVPGEPQSPAPASSFDGWEPPSAGGVFELTVPAASTFLDVVRMTTAGLAARLSLTLDDIEDLRSVVNEACVMVLALPGPTSGEAATLTCRYELLADVVAVRVSASVDRSADLPGRRSFAWHSLAAHEVEVDGAVEDGHAWIELRKPRH